MQRERLPVRLLAQVTSRALRGYATSLRWHRVDGITGPVSVFHRPDSRSHQVMIPEDATLADYAEAVEEAVRKLADFEHRPALDVLEQLPQPSADVLILHENGPDVETGSVPFDHAVRMMNGTRGLLLSAAQSVLAPQPFHARLARSEAEEFVGRCRLSQADGNGVSLRVACPLGPTEPGSPPFARRVAELVLRTLEALVQAGEGGEMQPLLDPVKHPGMSANFCESLALLRPVSTRACRPLEFAWSRLHLPASQELSRKISLHPAAFDVAEAIAPRLRIASAFQPSRYLGYVDALSGQPSRDDPRPFGEVEFTLFDDAQGELHARGVLNADDYAKAVAAHLASDVVAFKAILRPHARLHLVEGITDFERLAFANGKG